MSKKNWFVWEGGGEAHLRRNDCVSSLAPFVFLFDFYIYFLLLTFPFLFSLFPINWDETAGGQQENTAFPRSMPAILLRSWMCSVTNATHHRARRAAQLAPHEQSHRDAQWRWGGLWGRMAVTESGAQVMRVNRAACFFEERDQSNKGKCWRNIWHPWDAVSWLVQQPPATLNVFVLL